MDENTSTTDAANNSSGDANSITTDTNSNAATDTTQTGDKANNLESSTSTDTSTADSDTTSTTDTSGDAPAKFDNDIDEWIQKRGLPAPADDAAKQAYQDLRNSQREFTREQQAKKDADALKDGITTSKPDTNKSDDDNEEDPLEKEVRLLKEANQEERETRLRSEFYIENKVTPEQHKAIMDIFNEKMARPTTDQGKLAAFKTWSSPEALQDLLDLAKARVTDATSSDVVADQAAREERARIAKESQANSPGRNATNHSPSDKTADQQRTERLLARYS